VTFSADAMNSGVDPAGSFNVGFYLSADATLSASDTLVCEVPISGGLAAGASGHVSKACPIPPALYGTLKVFAKADSKDAVFETDETNNALGAPGTLNVAAPVWDLGGALLSDDGGSSLKVGQKLSFQLTVSNRGTDGIPGFDVDVVLSTDMTISSADPVLCTVTLGAVPAQSQAGFTFSCTIPSMTAGTYYTGVRLDPKDALAETDETNNTGVDTVPRALTP
jgi:subtilase family serine protease